MARDPDHGHRVGPFVVITVGPNGVVIPTDEHRDGVLSEIGEASGLAGIEIDAALNAFDELFPTESGWHHHFSNADYQFVKLTPAPLQGLGAFHQLRRAGAEDYDEYVTTGQYTASDLARRHNTAVSLLEAESALTVRA